VAQSYACLRQQLLVDDQELLDGLASTNMFLREKNYGKVVPGLKNHTMKMHGEIHQH
jgi:hypothetical protein